MKRKIKAIPKILITDADTILYQSLRVYNLELYSRVTGDGLIKSNEFFWLRLITMIAAKSGNLTLGEYYEGLSSNDAALAKGVVAVLIHLQEIEIAITSKGEHIYCAYAEAIKGKRTAIKNSAKKAADARWGNKPEVKKKKTKTQKHEKEKPVAAIIIEPIQKSRVHSDDADSGIKRKNKIARKKELVDTPPLTVEQTPPPAPAKKASKVAVFDAMEFVRTQMKNPVLQQAFADYLEVRKAKRTPITQSVIERLVKRLRVLSNEDAAIAVSIVDKSIRSGWTDFFPINERAMQMNGQTYNDVYEQLKQKYNGK